MPDSKPPIFRRNSVSNYRLVKIYFLRTKEATSMQIKHLRSNENKNTTCLLGFLMNSRLGISKTITTTFILSEHGETC